MQQEKNMKKESRACEMNIKMSQKVERNIAGQSFFGKLPDEMVLTILSYGEMEDIKNTRLWQSKKVQYWTETDRFGNLQERIILII